MVVLVTCYSTLKVAVGSDLGIADRCPRVAEEEEDSRLGLMIVGSSVAMSKIEMRYELLVGREAAARFACGQRLTESGLRVRIDNETTKAVQQMPRPAVPVLGCFDMRLATRGWYGESSFAVRGLLVHLVTDPLVVKAVL